MGSGAALLPTGSQRRFTKFLLGGIGVMAIAIAFGQHDRRGLLLYDLPEAFAARELAELSSPIGLESGIGIRRIVRSRSLPRQIGRPVAGQTPELGAGGGAGAGPTIGLQPFILPSPEPLSASSVTSSGDEPGQPTLALTNAASPGTGISPTPLVVPAAPGVVPIEPGVVPTVPDPVVPAVPEPASWVLMIIGIGALGAAMRRRRRLFGQLVFGN